jgi:hypothetical protein
VDAHDSSAMSDAVLATLSALAVFVLMVLGCGMYLNRRKDFEP